MDDQRFNSKKQLKEKKNLIDENKNLLCKHYKISKKEGLKVKFKSKLTSEIYYDIEKTNSIETKEKERELIETFQTYEQIDEKIDQLVSKLEKLPKRKIIEGYDVSYDLDLIRHQAFVLKRQIEALQKREKEIEIENQNRKIEMENSIKKEQAAQKNAMYKEKIYDYLKQTIDSKDVDVLFLFHGDYSTNLEFLYLNEKLECENCRHAKTFFDHSKNNFIMIDFDDQTIHKSNVDIIKFRQDILNLKWRQNSICVVLNLTFYLDSKYRESLNRFIFYQDEIKNQLDLKEIYFLKDSSSIITHNLINGTILKSKFLHHASKILLLKRFKLDSLDNVKEFLNKTAGPDEINYLSRLIRQTECCSLISFYKKSLFEPFSIKKESNYLFKVFQDCLSSSHNLYLINCLVRRWNGKTSYYWTQIFHSQEILNQIIEVHLTASLVVKIFNSNLMKCFFVPKIVQITYKNFYIAAIKMSLDISESKISSNQNIENDIKEELDCLTHFSFELSKNQFILKDFRTVFVKDKIMLTEPVIYSCVSNRFGSSDLGLKAINEFFDEHECNKHCRALQLTIFDKEQNFNASNKKY